MQLGGYGRVVKVPCTILSSGHLKAFDVAEKCSAWPRVEGWRSSKSQIPKSISVPMPPGSSVCHHPVQVAFMTDASWLQAKFWVLPGLQARYQQAHLT